MTSGEIGIHCVWLHRAFIHEPGSSPACASLIEPQLDPSPALRLSAFAGDCRQASARHHHYRACQCQVPVTPGKRFRACSMSKCCAALRIFILARLADGSFASRSISRVIARCWTRDVPRRRQATIRHNRSRRRRHRAAPTKRLPEASAVRRTPPAARRRARDR